MNRTGIFFMHDHVVPCCVIHTGIQIYSIVYLDNEVELGLDERFEQGTLMPMQNKTFERFSKVGVTTLKVLVIGCEAVGSTNIEVK